jgi:uncharacterized low-complexity protein
MMRIASLRRITLVAGALAVLALAAPPALAAQAPAQSEAKKCKGSSCRQSPAQRGGGGGWSGAHLLRWRISQAQRP